MVLYMIDIDINEIKENDVLNNVNALEKNNYGRFIITFQIGNEWYRLTSERTLMSDNSITVKETHFSESFSKRFIKQHGGNVDKDLEYTFIHDSSLWDRDCYY